MYAGFPPARCDEWLAPPILTKGVDDQMSENVLAIGAKTKCFLNGARNVMQFASVRTDKSMNSISSDASLRHSHRMRECTERSTRVISAGCRDASRLRRD